MAGAAGRRNPVPSTRTLEEQMDCASDKLQDLLTADIEEINQVDTL